MAGRKKKTLREIVQRAETAWRELELNQVTQANKQRAWDVFAGLRALDGEQARIKGAIEELVIEYFNPNAADDGMNELLRRLLELVQEPASPRSRDDQRLLDAIAHALTKGRKLRQKRRSQQPSKRPQTGMSSSQR